MSEVNKAENASAIRGHKPKRNGDGSFQVLYRSNEKDGEYLVRLCSENKIEALDSVYDGIPGTRCLLMRGTSEAPLTEERIREVLTKEREFEFRD